MNELKHGHGLAEIRVRGGSRVLFSASCKVIACNIKRWFRGMSSRPDAGALFPRFSGKTLRKLTLSARFAGLRLAQLNCRLLEVGAPSRA
jgi:hypothetical protein